MKLAVFLPNWIGDVVMATPALRAVRDRFPEAEIVGIMRPYVADVLAGTGLLNRSLFYNPRGNDAAQRGWPFLRALRAERFDTTLLLTNSLRTGWLAWLSGSRRRIGFARDLRGWLLTDRVLPRPRREPHPAMDEYLRLVERLGCTVSSRQIELAVQPEDQQRLDEFWNDVDGASNVESATSDASPSAEQRTSDQPRTSVLAPTLRKRYVCINTGGAFGAAKNWPREYFAELARRVVTELDRCVLIVCGPSEREDARWIADAANDPAGLSPAVLNPRVLNPAVSSLADVQLSIGLTKAAIRGAALLVTTDSGPRHFAAAFGTPVITLFGPTHIAWSETHYDRAEHLQLKLDCGPCQQRECPLKHHRCMRDLSVDTVFNAVRRQLHRHAHQRRVA